MNFCNLMQKTGKYRELCQKSWFLARPIWNLWLPWQRQKPLTHNWISVFGENGWTATESFSLLEYMVYLPPVHPRVKWLPQVTVRLQVSDYSQLSDYTVWLQLCRLFNWCKIRQFMYQPPHIWGNCSCCDYNSNCS